MDKQPVGQLPDLTQSNNDDEIMVITNSEYSQLKKEKISDLITDFTSTNENNALTKGTDGKMFVTDFGNASNITEGTLPVSVLPDIPKDKLPEIETDDLPDSGITAGTYTYPTDIVVNSKGQVTSITEGQAGANNANQDLSNLGPLGLDKINQSKALETGAVSSDADVYADIQKYAHSTFDLSKFEVVGSPVITDDGIASGFSVSNYINLGKYNIQNELHIKCNSNNVNLTGTHRGAIYSWYQNEQNYFRLFWYSNTQLRFDYFKQDESSVTLNSFNYDANGNYIFDIIYKNNKLLLLKDGEVIHTYNGAINLTVLNLVDGQLGVQPTGSWYLENGSIDLKSFSIWADGVPVFNGNKTGLYIAKPDNYEVVGSPTITDDGIASGFQNNTNYIRTPIRASDLLNKSWKITACFKPSNSTICLWKLSNESSAIGAEAFGSCVFNSNNNNLIFWYKTGDTDESSSQLYKQINLSNYLDKYVFVEYSFDYSSGVYTFKAWLADGTVIGNATYNAETSNKQLYLINTQSTYIITIGTIKNTVSLISGSIDLNAFLVYINGDLAYQPCLKIPYTLSKTGSKIVDVAYRDRVQDMYEQYGYAPYYTIDEENENFTLPMGEIYGMIAQNKTFDGFSLFDTKLTDRILTGDEALSWALQGSLVTMTYPDAVNRIKELYTAGTDTTYRGISCKKTTDGRYIADISQKTAIDTLYSETGIADFYILDSTNNQFYLPRNKYFMQLTDSTALLNSYNEPGLPNIEGSHGGLEGANFYTSGAFSIKDTTQRGGAGNGNGDCYVSFDASLSNPIYGNSETVQPPSSNKLLYYKVGHTVTNSGSIDVANVLSDINLLEANKADKDLSNCTKPYVTETYVNGTSWYRLWSDGWCEQGGQTAALSASTQTTIELLKEYSNTDYFINVNQPLRIGDRLPTVGIYQKNTANFIVQQSSTGNDAGAYATLWYACGF